MDRKQTTDTFYTRIPTLSEAELMEYITHYSKYRFEAIEAAAKELRKRGHNISIDELNTIQKNILNKNDYTPNCIKRLATHSKSIVIMILVVGLSSSVIVYLSDRSAAPNPLGYNPLDTKKYLRELEVYGGKVNILATELREWYGGLWHGKPLAFTIVFITVILAFLFWFLSTHHSSNSDAGGGTEKDHKKISS
jgi:hypothetical protein